MSASRAERQQGLAAENRVQKALEREFGERFEEKQLKVGFRWNGEPALKKFDAVYEESIVAMVKDYSYKNEAGNWTRHARVMRDLYYLSLVKAQRRYMYLSVDFYKWFVERSDAAIAPGVELREIPSN